MPQFTGEKTHNQVEEEADDKVVVTSGPGFGGWCSREHTKLVNALGEQGKNENNVAER